MHKARRDEAPRLPCQRQEDSPRNLGRPSYWPGRASGSALLQKYLENGGDESDDPTSIYPRTSKLPWQARRLTCLTLSTEADLDRRGRAIFTPTRTSPNSPLLPPPYPGFLLPDRRTPPLSRTPHAKMTQPGPGAMRFLLIWSHRSLMMRCTECYSAGYLIARFNPTELAWPYLYTTNRSSRWSLTDRVGCEAAGAHHGPFDGRSHEIA